MKKVLFLFVFAILISVNTYSQSVTALGNFIIEKDDFTTAKNLLVRSKYKLFSEEELKLFGHNPKTKVIGTKGSNKSDAIMAIITAYRDNNNRVEKAVFICNKAETMYLDRNLTNVGYELENDEEGEEDNRKIRYVTYNRKRIKKLDTVVIKYFQDGGSEATFFSS